MVKLLSKVICFLVSALALIPWIISSLLITIVQCSYILGWGKSEKHMYKLMKEFKWENRFVVTTVKPPWEIWDHIDKPDLGDLE